jgi:phosphate/sulfate permease
LASCSLYVYQRCDSLVGDLLRPNLSTAQALTILPWLAMLIGCAVYYLISRLKVKMPYTAIMFIVGAIMGFCSTENIGSNAVTESTKMWINIDGEVLLLAFLPGLLFLDSYICSSKPYRSCLSLHSQWAYAGLS